MNAHTGYFRVGAATIGWFLILACSFGGLIPASSSSTTEGPIIGMFPASSLNEQGQAVDPRFTFDSTDPQITVIAQVDPASQITDASLTVTWYQETFDGEQELFKHDLQVSAGEVAYSIGTNPATLAAGSYRVTASLEGQVWQMYFHVADPQVEIPGLENQVPTGQAAGGQPPVQGGSGTVPISSQAQGTGGGCILEVSPANGSFLVPHADKVHISLSLAGCDAADVELHARVKGPLLPYQTYHLAASNTSPHVIVGQFITLDPCALPGGSDIQGDTVELSAKVLTGSNAGLSTDGHIRIMLGVDNLPPFLHVVSVPDRGTKVKQGKKITLTIDAKEPQPGGPWQTGIRNIKVEAVPGGLVDERTYQFEPQKCEAKVKEVRPYKVTYVVPKKPPLKYDLCVSAYDHANEPTKQCGTYYAGDHWTAILDTRTTGDYGIGGTCSDEAWKTKLDLVVGEDGNVEGTAISNLVSQPQCAGEAQQMLAD